MAPTYSVGIPGSTLQRPARLRTLLMSLPLAQQKQALRRAALAARDALDAATRAAAAIAVVPRARALADAHARGPIALFSSIGSEIDTAPLAAALAAAGFELALPVVAGLSAPLLFRR